MGNQPEGLALYVRRIQKRHGSPEDFALKCRDHGMGWMAIGGPWQDAKRGTRFINDPKTCNRYLDALAKEEIEPWVWGYPWQGQEDEFADAMGKCAGDHDRALLDPELGSNPERSKHAHAMRKANVHAKTVVQQIKYRGFSQCGLSTYGSGPRIGWFPMEAFIEALVGEFGRRCFVGGQTYTENRAVDPSMEDFIAAVRNADAGWNIGDEVALVPNFGLYKWAKKDPSKPLTRHNRRATKKTAEELYWHLGEFIDDAEPVRALIGWAENFANRSLWETMGRFAEQMRRGACVLPEAL